MGWLSGSIRPWVNMVWCLLIDMGLKQDMWEEAVHMAVMLYNCIPLSGMRVRAHMSSTTVINLI
jgi:hypothetical protein